MLIHGRLNKEGEKIGEVDMAIETTPIGTQKKSTKVLPTKNKLFKKKKNKQTFPTKTK